MKSLPKDKQCNRIPSIVTKKLTQFSSGTFMALRKCDFCDEERECVNYEPDGWFCDRCQYIALVDT